MAGDRKLAVLLASLIAVTPLAIDVYLPAIPAIAQNLAADIHDVELSLGVFFLGLALGQLIGGPLSDLRGRRPIILIGLSIYLIGSVLTFFCSSIEQLLTARLIQAIGAGFSSVSAMATIRDRYQGREAARMFAFVGIIMMSAPLLAPIIGSILLSFFSWRSIFLALAIYGGIVSIAVLLFLRLPSIQQKAVTVENFVNIIQAYGIVFRTPKALGFLFFQAFSFSSMFAFLTESPFVYMEYFDHSDRAYALLFAANILVMAIFNRITAYKLKNTNPWRILRVGIFIQILANGSLFALVVFTDIQFWALFTLVVISIGSQGLIFPNTTACYMDFFKDNAGVANAVFGTTQFLIASIIGWITSSLHDGTVIPMASMMLFSILIAISFLYGFTLRNRHS